MEAPTIKVAKDQRVCKFKILLDGGASHDVYHSKAIPYGAVDKQVELADGLKTGYVKGDNITFVKDEVTEEQAQMPTIPSLGRVICQGAKMQWNKEGAILTLPIGRSHQATVINNCPYADEETANEIKEFQKIRA